MNGEHLTHCFHQAGTKAGRINYRCCSCDEETDRVGFPAYANTQAQ